MIDEIEFDPALFGDWPVGRGNANTSPGGEVRAVLLETKSEPSPMEAMELLLNDMRKELKAQFELYQKIRTQAEARIDGADEAEMKLGKADAKAAIEALSVIVRAIEKVDGLQRTLAEERMRADEEKFDDAAYEELLAEIDRRISEQAAKLHAGAADSPASGGTGPPSRE